VVPFLDEKDQIKPNAYKSEGEEQWPVHDGRKYGVEGETKNNKDDGDQNQNPQRQMTFKV
jgi:hypothetical protein